MHNGKYAFIKFPDIDFALHERKCDQQTAEQGNSYQTHSTDNCPTKQKWPFYVAFKGILNVFI